MPNTLVHATQHMHVRPEVRLYLVDHHNYDSEFGINHKHNSLTYEHRVVQVYKDRGVYNQVQLQPTHSQT